MELLVIKEMNEEDTHYLTLLQNQYERTDVLANWLKAYFENVKDPLYEVIMSVLVKK